MTRKVAAGGGIVVRAGDEMRGFDAVAVEVEDAGVAHGGWGKGLRKCVCRG
jgi:hypothetical protein